MNVQVRFHESAEQSLRTWIAELSAQEPNGAFMAALYLDDMQERLAGLAGELHEAIPDRTAVPVRYWWEYLPGFWIAYIVRDEGWWLWKKRRLIIVSVGEDPPDRVVAAFRRG